MTSRNILPSAWNPRILFAIFIIVLFFISACRSSRQQPTWSFLVYLDGDNSLSSNALSDLLEMAQVGSSDHVRVIVQMDQAGGVPARRYNVVRGGWEILSDLGEIDMASPQNLTDFLVWAKGAYPADRMVLLLWNHGNGWDQSDGPSSTKAGPGAAAAIGRSILYDDDNGMGGKSPFLPNHKVKQAIQAANILLDVLGLDASIMGTLEALYEFKDIAPILISSQEVGEAHGWDYTAILSSLVSDPGMSPEDLSRVIVDSYRSYLENVAYPSQPTYEKRHSIAAIRTAYLGPLAIEVESLAESFTARLNDPVAKDPMITLIGATRLTVQEIDKYVQPHVYVDLKDLDRLLNQGTDIPRLLEAATISEYHGEARPNANGMSIVFFGLPDAKTWNTFDPNYKDYDAGTNTGNGGDFINEYHWDEFLAAYYAAAGL